MCRTGKTPWLEWTVTLAIGSVTFGGRADAASHRVPGEFETIQAGIDACAVGDTVLLAPGTYMGDGNRDLVIRSEIVVRSENGAEETWIDCLGQYENFHRGISIAAPPGTSPKIEGLTITNGWEVGAGIRIESSSPVICECVLIDNLAGGEVDGRGGGVLCLGESRTLIRNCEITGSFCDAVLAEGSTHTVIEGCRIWGNIEGAIHMDDDASMQVTGCWIAYNKNGNPGAGIHHDASGRLEIEDCIIVLNETDLVGSAISAEGEALRITGSTIAGNVCRQEDGAAISCQADEFRMERSICFWNWGRCADQRTGIFLTGASNQIICSAVDSTYIDLYGSATVEYIGEQVFTDPMFCHRLDCYFAPGEEDYGLEDGSPCLPENSPCGQRIGALDLACSGQTPTKTTTWGKIRAGFR